MASNHLPQIQTGGVLHVRRALPVFLNPPDFGGIAAWYNREERRSHQNNEPTGSQPDQRSGTTATAARTQGCRNRTKGESINMLHGKLQNVAEQRTLLYGLSAIGVTVLLSLHTFVTSTLSHVPSAMLGFLLNTLAVVLTVVFAAKKLTPMALHSAVFMAVLLLGSNSTVLISTYNIGSEVGNLGLWMGIRSCGMLLLAAVMLVSLAACAGHMGWNLPSGALAGEREATSAAAALGGRHRVLSDGNVPLPWQHRLRLWHPHRAAYGNSGDSYHGHELSGGWRTENRQRCPVRNDLTDTGSQARDRHSGTAVCRFLCVVHPLLSPQESP